LESVGLTNFTKYLDRIQRYFDDDLNDDSRENTLEEPGNDTTGDGFVDAGEEGPGAIGGAKSGWTNERGSNECQILKFQRGEGHTDTVRN
jgi:hypothetical protein